MVRDVIRNGPRCREMGPRPFRKWSAMSCEMVRDHFANGPRPFLKWSTTSRDGSTTISFGQFHPVMASGDRLRDVGIPFQRLDKRREMQRAPLLGAATTISDRSPDHFQGLHGPFRKWSATHCETSRTIFLDGR